MRNLEVWADSFHEGEWFLSNLLPHFTKYRHQYLHGFIPEYTIDINEDVTLRVIIFGSYSAWDNLPNKIRNLLDFGKPDIVLYDRDSDKIILAIEETAAVPTGNQALQRCEHIFGSAYLKVPFVYLLPQYGTHSDGKNRRTSIWPTLLMLKLSLQFQTPSISLLYSDIDNPEDYSKGSGLAVLFKYAFYLTLKHLGMLSDENYKHLNLLLTAEVKNMCDFVKSQWGSITNYFPGIEGFNSQLIADLAKKILDDKVTSETLNKFLDWPTTDKLPVKLKQISLGFINNEPFLERVDKYIKDGKGYVISLGVGSRPQSSSDIEEWISLQRDISKKHKLSYQLPVNKFQKTDNGNYHITTSKNITYLIDDISYLDKAYNSTFPERKISLKDLLTDYENLPVFLYICNSLKPGRMFGDPFTGQFSAFANIFCYDASCKKTRSAIIYLPYQSCGLFYNQSGEFIVNKGTNIYSKLADLIICNNGYVVSLISKGKIYGIK